VPRQATIAATPQAARRADFSGIFREEMALTLRFKITCLLVLAVCALAFVAGRGSHSQYVDFAFRVGTLVLFTALVCHLWGARIKAFFRGRSERIKNELAALEEAKTRAFSRMKLVEEQISSLDKDRQNILAEYRAQGEALKSEIIIKAERSARQIIAQARASAQSEADRAVEEMRAELAEEIVAAAQKLLVQHLTVDEHEKLINKSLTRVVLN
jgi:F-type H+-transporting ATPase subunit b